MGAAAGALGGAVISGIATDKAAGKASDAQLAAADVIKNAAQAARADILKLFPAAKQELLTGAQGAFDVFGQAIPLQQQQLSAGNLAAQQSAAQGFDQAQAALLGLPTQQFQAQAVPFSQDPFLGGQSLFGTPQQFQGSGGEVGFLPTFAGLGGSFAPAGEPEQIVNGQPVPEVGQGGLGTPITNPNIFTGIQTQRPGFGQIEQPAAVQQQPLFQKFQGQFLGQ